MRTYDATAFIIPNGASESQEITTPLSDADHFYVFPPTGAEADIQVQVWNGSGWAFYDATNFTAGIDNYKEFAARGLKYKLKKRAATVAAERIFEIVKRVGNS